MTQMVTRVGSSTAPTGVVTVAELLTRYAPDLSIEAEPPTVPVSVGSLLRREGRAPHAQDRPLSPRSRSASASDDDHEPRRGSGALVRRSAIAAGALLAAGSVFGATVVMDASSSDGADGPQAGYAGEGRPDLPSTPGVPTVVDTAAQTDRLDAGDAPPMSWLDVAFPDDSGTATGGAATGGGGTPVGSSVPDTIRTPSTPAAAPGQVDDDTGGGGGSGGSSDDESGSGGSSTADDQGDGDQGDRGLGSGLQGVGQGVGGPVGGVVGGVVGGLSSAVSDVGSTVESDEPSVIGGLAGGLL